MFRSPIWAALGEGEAGELGVCSLLDHDQAISTPADGRLQSWYGAVGSGVRLVRRAFNIDGHGHMHLDSWGAELWWLVQLGAARLLRGVQRPPGADRQDGLRRLFVQAT